MNRRIWRLPVGYQLLLAGMLTLLVGGALSRHYSAGNVAAEAVAERPASNLPRRSPPRRFQVASGVRPVALTFEAPPLPAGPSAGLRPLPLEPLPPSTRFSPSPPSRPLPPMESTLTIRPLPAVEDETAADRTNTGRQELSPPASNSVLVGPAEIAEREPADEPSFAVPEFSETFPPPQSPLPAAGNPGESPRPPIAPPRGAASAMTAVSKQAEELIAEGFSLAGRGAFFSARSDLIRALRIVAQALDVQDETAEHSRALADALRAMEEADDFVPQGSQLEGELNVLLIARSHRTKLLEEQPASVSPVVALQQYYTFAQERLAAACGPSPSASMALFGLGKLHGSLAEQSAADRRRHEPKAMVFHQAAMLVDARNHLAANELGVLLARYGQLEDARRVLLRAVATGPTQEGWHNLAVVHERLGEQDLAERAQNEARLASRTPAAPYAAGSQVRWVKPDDFARLNPPGDSIVQP